ncbi:MAG: peroxiredoxin family protein [Prosthecobacter sp.]
MMKIFYRCLAALCCLSWAGIALAKEDASWDRVALIVTGIQDPKPEPTTREQSIELLTKGLAAFDEAYAAALKVDPENPMRWEAALFDAMTRPSRQIIGLPPPEKTHFTLADILEASDAPAGTKAKASYLNVMNAADAPEMDLATWVGMAEKHLKKFPLLESNEDVRGKLAQSKILIKLTEKPMDLKFTATDGREVDLEKMRGKVVLIDFWATWCPLCIAALPQVRQVYKEQQAHGFEVVGISLDSEKEVMDAFVKENAMPWPQYYDGKGWENNISSKYGISQLPAMWLIDKKGMLASIHGEHNLAEKVAQLLKE